MADEQIVETGLVTQDGKRVVVTGDSLAAASPLAKGAVLQGDGVAKIAEISAKNISQKFNDMLSNLRANGVLGNDKFVVFYDPNYTEELDEDWYYDIYDEGTYTEGQSATVKFEFGKDDDYVPYRSGYRFKGWALTPNAQTPDYPYDENDPQTYTVTFVDDDITLYAIWELRTCTLTYAIGTSGEGNVPQAQTVPEGENVIIESSPAPTVKDGSGRVFIGWSTNDSEDGYYDVIYGGLIGHGSLYLYEDVTLYPVFAAQYSITYALGNDATGTVPGMQTGYNEQTLDINFNQSVTCVSDNTKVFVGWSETDEDTTATYTANGTNSIYMNRNVTLYPVFAAQAQGGSITIVNNSTKGYSVEVYENDTNVLTIGSGSQETLNYVAVNDYEIHTILTNAAFDGVYQGTQYSNVTLGHGNDKIYNPKTYNQYWEFSDGDSGTLTIS